MTDTPLIRPAKPGDLKPSTSVCLPPANAGEDVSRLFQDHRTPWRGLRRSVRQATPSGSGSPGSSTTLPPVTCWEPRSTPGGSRPNASRGGGRRSGPGNPDPVADPSIGDEEVVALIHEPELAAEEVVAEYPAHLHLDLLPVLQGKGVGRIMMELLLEELRERGVPAVHLGADARNHHAIGFYEHLGFTHLDDSDDVVMGIRLD